MNNQIRSGVARWTNGACSSDEQAVLILKKNGNISNACPLMHGFVQIDFKEPLNFLDVQEFKKEMRKNGIFFSENPPASLSRRYL